MWLLHSFILRMSMIPVSMWSSEKMLGKQHTGQSAMRLGQGFGVGAIGKGTNSDSGKWRRHNAQEAVHSKCAKWSSSGTYYAF